MNNIACVVPTIRESTIPAFLKEWQPLFDKHHVKFILVVDSDEPIIKLSNIEHIKIPKNIRELTGHHGAMVRNYGFWYISKFMPEIEYIITLDDDETPIEDPIQDHIDQLNRRVPISWLSTSLNAYMRGFPYGVRNEAPVMLSHGIWQGVPDLDAPTQLNWDNRKVEFYKGIIPKGCLFPMCGMNLAFRRKALPYMFFAPVGQTKGMERFDDMIAGLEIKRIFDNLGWACVTGYAEVLHNRASNMFTSLSKEYLGIAKYEEYWKGNHDEWYKDYLLKKEKWYELMQCQ